MIQARTKALTRPRHRGAYSLIEVLITVLITQIIAGMVMVNVSSVTTSERLSRASEQVVIALRYSRILAMSTGQPAGVEFDTSANTIRVFQGTAATTVTNSQVLGGTYQINLNTQSDVSGVRVTSALIASDTTNPYRVIFGTLGGTLNNGYITLTYGTQSRTIMIPLVGEPKIQ